MATDVKLARTAIVTPSRTVAACAPGTKATGASIRTSASRSPTSLNSSPRAWIRPVRRARAPSSRLRTSRDRGRQRHEDQDPGADGDTRMAAPATAPTGTAAEGQGIGPDAGSLESPEDGVETAQQRRFDAVQIHGPCPPVVDVRPDGREEATRPPT